MGQQSSSQNPCQNFFKPSNKGADDLVFYLTVDDKQFGNVPVYTSTKRPSSYVAKIQKPVKNSKIFNIFQQIQNSQLSCLGSLHAFEITRQKYVTGHLQQKITAYWEYYNYCFEDFLKMRFLKRMPFTESQIWFIIKCCCQSFSLLSLHNLVLDLDLKHIMVVPEGKLKIYWHKIEYGNSHLRYHQRVKQALTRRQSVEIGVENRQFRVLDEKQSENFFFSPEEIQGIQKRQQTMKIDFTRANSFRLGMIILYCITLTNPIKTCYGTNNATGQKRIKLMVLNSLYETKIQASSKYSDDLKHLIKLLLLEDPNKRIRIDCLQDVYEKYMSGDTELSLGMVDSPLYAPSSSRKNLKQDENRGRLIDPKEHKQTSSHKNILSHQKNSSKFNSEKVIDQSRVKSVEKSPQNNNQNLESGYSNEAEVFDKFDTKTIKISSSYHKK